MMPGCRDISRRLSEARDSGRRLAFVERFHLWICETCRRLRVQFDALGAAAARVPEDGPVLSAAARERLRKSLKL